MRVTEYFKLRIEFHYFLVSITRILCVVINVQFYETSYEESFTK